MARRDDPKKQRTAKRTTTRRKPTTRRRRTKGQRKRAGVLRRLAVRLLLMGLILGLILGATAALGLWVYARQLEPVVVEKLAGQRWSIPSKIYSDSLLLYPGLDVDAAGLASRLRRLDYREVSNESLRRGDYRRESGRLEIFLHDFSHPGQVSGARHVRLELSSGILTRIRDVESGEEIFSIQLEPEVITGLYDVEWEERRVVHLDDVPAPLVQAILTTEDRRFYDHHGIDPVGIARAMWVNLWRGRITQGGSTLTQQLMKNFFLTQERTLRRKLQEAVMAIIAERRYDKDFILESYLNEIYLGQNGVQGIFGVWEASQFYFGRPPDELSLAEMAMIAGLIRAPNSYSPHAHPERARERRNLVLRLMLEREEIDRASYVEAAAEPLRPPPRHTHRNPAPYFVDFLRRELDRDYSHGVLTAEGLRIFTGLDVHLQQIAREAVRNGLEKLETGYPGLRTENAANKLQACLIALHPQTGEIRAMVGGREYGESQFNRCIQARRQPGSVFKPFVYLTAFEQAHRAGRALGPTAMIEDEPFGWEYDSKVWRPENYEDHYLGTVTLRRALEASLNAATARLAHRVGLAPIRETVRRMGLQGPIPPYPSMILGALEASPYEIAQAYAVFANQGLRPVPRAIRRVIDPQGSPVESRPLEIERVVSPEAAFLVNHMMQGVMDHGTGHGARRRGFDRPAAGKTGTTNDAHDAWFAGFTPELLTVVWVGFDEQRGVGLTGAQAALPIWTEFMKRATAPYPPSSFPAPPGVAVVRIDPYTGGLATPDCPETRDEAFWRGHEPDEPCRVHRARGRFPW